MTDNRQNGSTSTEEKPDYVGIMTTVVEVIVLIVRYWITVFEALFKMFSPPAEENVSGENILITGTGHGIGKQLALKYAKLGANVICWDINEKNNNDTVKEIKAAGGKAVGYVCNVVKREEVNEIADKMKKEHGFIGIVINNAGIMPCHPLMETTETEIRNMFEINVLAHFWIIQAFLPEMLNRNQGHFVALSSCAGLFGIPNLVPYCGTKFAVRGLMTALSEELYHMNSSNNIKFTTIYPYIVDTGLCKNPRNRFKNMTKIVTPEEAADSIISAQRTGMVEASIPRRWVNVDKVTRFMPLKGVRLINKFMDTGVDSDKH